MGRRGRRALILLGLLGTPVITFWSLPAVRFPEVWSPALFARGGELLDARVAADGQWRFPPSSAVAPKFEAALLVQEDKRFYAHRGVDAAALIRAAKLNVARRRVVSGGSTLTMQVVRLSRRNPTRTFAEKFHEMALALKLEKTLSKKKILGLYCERAPFGENVVGLEAASWRIFGRAPERLSWAEASALAVLPNNPAFVHAGRNRETFLKKRDRLLRALRAAGKLDDLELSLALRERLPEAPRPFPHLAPHLLATLNARRGSSRPRFDTTLDARLQQDAQEIVARRSEALGNRGIKNAAAVILDNRDGSLLAYVGNSKVHDYESSGYAVDIARQPRSTGSVLKPFLYASMMQAGELLPETLIADVPTQYDGFTPENNDRRYRGAVRAKEALAKSLNVPAVRLLREHGAARFHGELTSWGFSTLRRSADQYGLTLILGGAEGTLIDITRMYSGLARTAADADQEKPLAGIGPGAAWLTLETLLDVVRPEEEAPWRKFSSGQRIAWKTGTSVGFRDGWALGVDAAHTVGVWTGNASGEGRADLTGTGAAAPILFDLFRRLGPGGWFTRPDLDLTKIRVCRDDGRLPAEGCAVETVWAPADAPYQTASSAHAPVHLDPAKPLRVHAGCESVSRMRHAVWFSLPPVQEFYYRRLHPEYRPLPPWRSDCRGPDADSPVAFVYPHAEANLYIPVELDGEKGRTVFEAADTRPNAVLHWHLDGRYLGSTETIHQRALDMEPGSHSVTVVDDWGNQATRRFKVLGL